MQSHESRAVVVAQLVERLLPTPEVRDRIQSLAKFISCRLYLNDDNKEKEAGNGPFFKKVIHNLTNIDFSKPYTLEQLYTTV